MFPVLLARFFTFWITPRRQVSFRRLPKARSADKGGVFSWKCLQAGRNYDSGLADDRRAGRVGSRAAGYGGQNQVDRAHAGCRRNLSGSVVCAFSYMRLFKMPQGGSITVMSMLPVMLFAYLYGVAPVSYAAWRLAFCSSFRSRIFIRFRSLRWTIWLPLPFWALLHWARNCPARISSNCPSAWRWAVCCAPSPAF